MTNNPTSLLYTSPLETFQFAETPDQTFSKKDRYRNDENSIILVLKGAFTQEIDFETYDLSTNQMVFVPRGVIQREDPRQLADAYVIRFQDTFFSEPMLKMIAGFMSHMIFRKRLVLTLSETQTSEFLKLAAVIEQEKQQKFHQNQVFILQNLLLVWLNKMESIAQNFTENNWHIEKGGIFQQFTSLLAHHYREHKEVSYYCDVLQCTAAKLSQIVKTITGKTTNELIIDTILLEAKRDLSYTNKSIKEIAFALGYANQFYFSRLFKSKTSLSPDEFRKRYGL